MSDQTGAPNGTTAAPPDTKKLNKLEGVKRALKALGNDAMPADLRKWMKDHLNIDADNDLISKYKGDIIRGRSPGKPAAKKTAAPKSAPTTAAGVAGAPAAARVTPPAAKPTPAGFQLEDIAAVKGLLDRLGVDQLRALVSLLSR